MYLLRRGNWLLQRLVAFSLAKRITLTIMVISIPLLIWYLCLYTTIENLICYYQKQIASIKQHEQLIQDLNKKSQSISEAIAASEQQLNSYCLLKKEAKKSLQHFAIHAKEQGICLDTGYLDVLQDNASYCITLEGHGSIDQINNFLYACCTKNPLLSFEQLGMNLIKNNIYHASIKLCLK